MQSCMKGNSDEQLPEIIIGFDAKASTAMPHGMHVLESRYGRVIFVAPASPKAKWRNGCQHLPSAEKL